MSITYPQLDEPFDDYFFADGDEQTTGDSQFTWDEAAGEWVEAPRPDGT